MTVLEEIQDKLGREVEFEQVTFKGQQGFLPIYFNHTDRSFVSTVFAKTEEEAANNFLEYLTVRQGDTDEQSRDSSKSGDGSED